MHMFRLIIKQSKHVRLLLMHDNNVEDYIDCVILLI